MTITKTTTSVPPARGVLINTSARPRILVWGFDKAPDLAAEILALGATSRRITSINDVRQAEWDVLVTDHVQLTHEVGHNYRYIEPSLCVLLIAADADQRIENSLKVHDGHVCQELLRITDLPESVRVLAHEQLEPVAKARSSHLYFEVPSPSGIDFGAPLILASSRPVLEPFLQTADNKVLAGRYKRSPKTECWLLPSDTPDPVEWVKAALTEWHELDPTRFPGLPNWSRTPKWMTSRELAIESDLKRVDAEREEYLRKAVEREAELKGQLAQARNDADANERALLTTQSDPLKDAAMAALRFLGFAVTDADLTAKPDEHLEDLRIEDPDVPGWIALGEVKGYTKGAATAGMSQLTRFRKRYVLSTGADADASWYIVNHFLDRDPSTRQAAFHGSGDVEAFAEDQGLIINTVDLFRLLGQVEREERTPVEARRLLRESTGRLRL